MNDLFIKTEPEVREIYQAILDGLSSLNPMNIELKKTSIHLVNQKAFAGIHPRKNSLILNIVSESKIESNRVFKCEQVSKNRFHNEIKLFDVNDVDSELLAWLAEAHDLMS